MVIVATLLVTALQGGALNSVSAQEVVLTYGIWDSRQEPGLREIADDFEAENPGIKIELQVTGWGEYWTMLEAAATGGSLPDIFWMHSNEIYKYGSNDMLLNLDEYIGRDSIDLTKFPQGLVDIYNVNESQYAIPKDFDTIGLWYNKTMFDEAGLDYPDETWTWETLREAAEILTDEEKGQYGMSAQLSNQEGYYNFVYQNGGTILTDERTSGYDLPETIEALEYYFSFVHDGLSPESYTDTDSRAFLENGIAAMATFGSWQLPAFLDNEYLVENFDVAPLPSKEGNSTTIYNGLGNAIDANTENPEEAWLFLSYLSSEPVQRKASELGIAISAYEGTAEAWIDSNTEFNLKVYVDMVESGQIRPYTNETTVWEEKAYELLNAAYRGEQSVEEGAKATAEMMNQFISQE
ncbi:extracellular solute-binding protein [Aerococcaceae bacterium DSM 109652]|uniref:Extracellular solute-binding protein n=2 Tax=Fundicoccus ignavus TaxID=2664442 RepID=A0A844BW03_9LACT|nr:extracellular solute-binding protein [Fundicoccus ignavus]